MGPTPLPPLTLLGPASTRLPSTLNSSHVVAYCLNQPHLSLM